MRVVIAGAGNVGRSIARELLGNGHKVLLIDRSPTSIRPEKMPDAEWLLADCCEMSTLEEADLEHADVAIAATGDDKANLVHSLLAKTEFGVPRTVARVNHPGNEWMFDDVWGVDVAVSTPRLMCALVEEAVAVGDLIKLFTFKGNTDMMEFTVPPVSECVGRRVRDMQMPGSALLVAIIRDGYARAPEPDAAIEAHDELLFIVDADHASALAESLTGKGVISSGVRSTG